MSSRDRVVPTRKNQDWVNKNELMNYLLTKKEGTCVSSLMEWNSYASHPCRDLRADRHR